MAEDVRVPLPQFGAEIAKEAAWTVIKEHRVECDIHRIEIRVGTVEGKVEKLQLSMARLIGAMVGSGLLGGATSGFISNFWGQ